VNKNTHIGSLLALASMNASAGWFGPDNYAEGMRDELKDIKRSGTAIQYAMTAAKKKCFEKFCEEKVRYEEKVDCDYYESPPRCWTVKNTIYDDNTCSKY